MNHLTFEQAEQSSQKCDYAIEAAGTKENPINWGDAAGFYLSGYNACADEAEKIIQEATELANRSYNEGLRDGGLPIPGLEKQIAELQELVARQRNTIANLLLGDNPSQALPEHTIAELIKRLDKLEAFGISDGSKIRIGSFGGTVTKIR